MKYALGFLLFLFSAAGQAQSRAVVRTGASVLTGGASFPNTVVISSSNRDTVQAAITAAPVGSQVILSAVQVNTGSNALTIVAKDRLTLMSINNTELFSSTQNLVLLIGAGVTNRLHIAGFRFRSTSTGGGLALVSSIETSQINGWELDHCFFTNASSTANALGMVQYSTGSSSGQTSYDIYHHDNTFENIGRMAGEYLSQGYDGVQRIVGLRFEYNIGRNLGANNQFGMMFSASGLMRNISVRFNEVTDAKDKAYEIVNATDWVIQGNYSYWVSNTFDGISCSDDSRGTTQRGVITGNVINAKGNVLQLLGVQKVTIADNILTNSVSPDGIRGRVYFAQNLNGTPAGWPTSKVTFTGNTVETASSKVLEIDNATNIRVNDNFISNALGTVGTERVTIRNSLATGSTVTNNTFARNAGNANATNVNQTGGAAGNTIEQ